MNGHYLDQEEADGQAQGPRVVETSLLELLEEADLAMQAMSRGNPHRRVIYRLSEALKAVCDRYVQKCGEHDELRDQYEQKFGAATEEKTYGQPRVEVPAIVITDSD